MVLSHGTLLVYLEHYKLILQTMLGPDHQNQNGKKIDLILLMILFTMVDTSIRHKQMVLLDQLLLYIQLVLLVMEISTGHMFQHIQD